MNLHPIRRRIQFHAEYGKYVTLSLYEERSTNVRSGNNRMDPINIHAKFDKGEKTGRRKRRRKEGTIEVGGLDDECRCIDFDFVFEGGRDARP